MEVAILQSFDKLDAFGPIGVYRIISPLSIRGYSVGEIVDWVLGTKRLEKKWDAIQFLELKKKYQSDYQYSIRYFKDLARALGLKKCGRFKILETSIYAR